MHVENRSAFARGVATSALTISLIGGTFAAGGAIASASPSASAVVTTVAAPHNPTPSQGEQIGALARQVINWARQQGGALWSGLTSAVESGWRVVSTWITTQLPSFLRDIAIALGADAVAQWIVANWPF